MGTHTAIVAQSGSGKSFFLGRIVEEIMLKTKACCLILDPNADFRKVRQVEETSLWDKAAYDRDTGRGKLPHERSREEFYSRWSKIPIRIRANLDMAGGGDYEQIRILWPSLSMAFLAEDVNPMLRSDLYHCHAFVRALARILDYKALAAPEIHTDLIAEAQRVFHFARSNDVPKSDLRQTLEKEFSAEEILNKERADFPVHLSRSVIERAIHRFVEVALTVSEYVNKDVERFYFGKAREFQAAGILQTTTVKDPLSLPRSNRLEVVDLPSLADRNTRLLVISALLTTEWERARSSWSEALERPWDQDERVPTFIVVDEAHNLIPKKPRSKLEAALKEQFRTIVAEGRKYGLFLVVVSQRPDKLDSLILSECDNRAVMRLRSVSVLNITRKMLGLDDLQHRFLEKCLDFGTGRALLAGPWSPQGAQVIYGAARRTLEGGRNLRGEYWANSSDAS
jgi:hypothetical protein